MDPSSDAAPNPGGAPNPGDTAPSGGSAQSGGSAPSGGSAQSGGSAPSDPVATPAPVARSPRIRAPEFHGRSWLNTGGRDLTLASLRGRIVLVDFWTFCCINCLHVLDELRPIEEKYGDVLVTVGVHSPKFEHEKDPRAVAAAVERYGVTHPVLDDPELQTWDRYTARAWPTLAVVDPEGYLVASMAGEGHAAGLVRLLDELIGTHEARGTLRRGDGPYVPPQVAGTPLRYPGKAVVTPAGDILVTSTAQHQVVCLAPDAETVKYRVGTGSRGRTDGRASTATFNEPQGLCLLPPDVAGIAGYDLVVADTVNHLVRGVRLSDGAVTTVAGTGRQWRSTVDDLTHDALAVDLSSPWDAAWYQDMIVIAMAGTHQLWWFDPLRRTAGRYAGTTVEALRDGPLPDVWMAQPSGLSAAGEKLWIADSESSALRWISADRMHTAVGTGLFDFGHVDGAADRALLQHPLGVLALPDGAVLVADTYNGAVRRYDPATRMVATVASGLAEPSGLARTGDGGVLVVESSAHRLIRLAPGDLAAAARATGTSTPDSAGSRYRTHRPVTDLAPGEVTLDVVFEPPPGQKLDDTYGSPIRLAVSASPPELLVEGAGSGTELRRRLVLADSIPDGVIQVVAQAATCDAGSPYAACHLTRQDWGVPVRLTASGPNHLALILRGLDPAGSGPDPR